MNPPEWLVDPDELKIFTEAARLIGKRGITDPDPARVAAYAYCMARALRYSKMEPARIIWIGALPFGHGPTEHPRWIGYPPRPGVNPLVYLWKRGARYAENGLLWQPKPIPLFELLEYDMWEELDEQGVWRIIGGEVIFHLDSKWEN